MPSRTYHHKSRHGCINCKQKRKKCDQQRPVCSACARRRVACVYEQVLDSAIITNAGPQSLVRPLATEWDTLEPSIQAILSLQVPHVHFSDIEMIYYFRTRDPTTLDTMPGISRVRRLDLVKILPENPYLLYGLIAASALHSRSGVGPHNESSRLLLEEKATNFYQLSLSAYRARLNFIDKETCSSIFAFSVTLAGLSFGLMRPEQDVPQDYCQEHINGIIGIFNLLLGAVTVANEMSCKVAVSENPLMLPIRTSLPLSYESAGDAVHDILDSLPSKIRIAHAVDCSRNVQAPPIDISVIYDSAIPELRSMFFGLQTSEPSNILRIFSWAAFVGRPFVSLVEQHHPAALVVLAHYGVALQALNRIWWLRGVGAGVIRSVVEVMAGPNGNGWREMLRWPMEKLEYPDLGEAEAHTIHLCQSAYNQLQGRHSESVKWFEMSLAITENVSTRGTSGARQRRHD